MLVHCFLRTAGALITFAGLLAVNKKDTKQKYCSSEKFGEIHLEIHLAFWSRNLMHSRLLLTFRQAASVIMPVLNHRSAWYPYICFISLFPKENPTFCSAIALEAVPAINQSGRPWHTAQLAALTWYITQAVAAPHTPPSSKEFHLMPWFCGIWSSREKKSFSMLCLNINFLWFSMYLEALWGQTD